MEKQQLAIASIPCQNWGEIYSPEEALKIGTIFAELNMPFYVTGTPSAAADRKEKKILDSFLSEKNGSQDTRAKMIQAMDEISFVLDDLTLYLDTHSEDPNGLALFQEFTKKRAELKKQFAQDYEPLTRDCLAECGDSTAFCWLNGPAPWEGACM